MWIQRDANNAIVGVYETQQAFTTEQLAANNAEVFAFLNPPPPKITVVTAVQARMALAQANVLNRVISFMKPLATTNSALIYWEYATEFHRYNPILINVATQLGLSNTDIDNLFISAKTFN